jgi:hypothetical protein
LSNRLAQHLLRLARLADSMDSAGRFGDAELLTETMKRIAQAQQDQSQMGALLQRGVQGVEDVGSGVGQAVGGAYNAAQLANPAQWAVAAGGDVVSGIKNQFQQAVDSAVSQRLRSMGIDPSKTGASPQAAAPNAATGVASGAASAQAGGAAGENQGLVQRYLGYAFSVISQKHGTGPEARAELQRYLIQNRQSPQFQAQVLQQYDSRIGNQQAVQRLNGSLGSPAA